MSEKTQEINAQDLEKITSAYGAISSLSVSGDAMETLAFVRKNIRDVMNKVNEIVTAKIEKEMNENKETEDKKPKK